MRKSTSVRKILAKEKDEACTHTHSLAPAELKRFSGLMARVPLPVRSYKPAPRRRRKYERFLSPLGGESKATCGASRRRRSARVWGRRRGAQGRLILLGLGPGAHGSRVRRRTPRAVAALLPHVIALGAPELALVMARRAWAARRRGRQVRFHPVTVPFPLFLLEPLALPPLGTTVLKPNLRMPKFVYFLT